MLYKAWDGEADSHRDLEKKKNPQEGNLVSETQQVGGVCLPKRVGEERSG